MRRIVSVAPALVVLVVAVVTLAAAPPAIRSMQVAQTRARVALAQQRLADNDVLRQLSDAVADLAEVVEPGVVHIDAFARRGPRGPISTGSGWVYDDRGHIVTNAHVVRGADVITVQFSDGYTVTAEFVGLDTPTDVGVIRVDPDAGVVPLRRATGERLRQGQRVYAFGSPFGFRFSMSEGIVSALGRNAMGVTGINGYTNFIQTDAAVNPGNSGGPLVDVHGRVVGMNTAIVTADNPNASLERQGQSAGIGFAVPLDTIESVAGQIIETGVVVKGYLGISLADTVEVPLSRLPEGFRGSGVVVLGVVDHQPAARAGLEEGDVIVAVNGERTPDSAVLRAKIGSTRPGQTVDVHVVRAGPEGLHEITLQVQVGAAVVAADNTLVAVEENQTPAQAIEHAEEMARLNAEVLRMNRALAALARVGVPDLNLRRAGVALEIRPDSPAAKAGLVSGQIVETVNGHAIAGYQDFTDAVASALEQEPRPTIEIVVRDEHNVSRTVAITLERP